MHKLIIKLHVAFLGFERWFDRSLGWFFTNGMKNEPGRTAVVKASAQEGSAPTV